MSDKEIEIKKDGEVVEANNDIAVFMDYLMRNNRQIREDRAEVIAEDTQITFRRVIEDIGLRIKKLKRERDNMLDLAPDHALSLKLAENFNATEFVAKDLRLGVLIRNEEVKLEIAKKRYNFLFGGDITVVE